VAALARSGAPVAAECAGLLYLATDLDGAPMCGVLGARARMTGRLTLGYRDATAATASVLAPPGAAVRGHEFHRTTTEPASSRSPAWHFTSEQLATRERARTGGPAGDVGRAGDGGRAEGFVQGSVHASYLHLHWAARPEIASRLVTAAGVAVASAVTTAGAVT
jgi:cobyrinic acid a,c-diamide synthase